MNCENTVHRFHAKAGCVSIRCPPHTYFATINTSFTLRGTSTTDKISVPAALLHAIYYQ